MPVIVDQRSTRENTSRLSEAELRAMLEQREAVKEAHLRRTSRTVTMVLVALFAALCIAFFAPSSNREAISDAVKELLHGESASAATPPPQAEPNNPPAPNPESLMNPADMKFAGEFLRFIKPQAAPPPKPPGEGK